MGKETKIIASVVGVLVSMGVSLMVMAQNHAAAVVTTGKSSYCAMDVRICPDGTYVSRVEPSCDFAACADISQ